MPDKDGDEGKSTKSVVNKKQKQMMGEEGYDIARDMGKVRPSKDKKDATTLRKPPSKEMKKTQKVVKGPSAFERVKAKYGKSVMNVGKKKVKEELDLTKVAEIFGGYIVEGKVEDEKKKADAQFKKDFADPLSRGTVTQKALPLYKAGGPFVPDRTVDKRTGEKVQPMEKKPYLGKKTVPTKKKTFKFDGKEISRDIPKDTGSRQEIGKNLMKFGQFSQKLAKLRKDVDKSKQDVVDVETDKFFKDLESKKREDNVLKSIETGRTKSGEDASKIGTRDISTLNPDEKIRRGIGGDSTGGGSTEGSAGGEGPKNQSGVVKFSSGARGTSPSGSPEMGGESGKFANRKRGPSGAIPFKQFKDEIPISPSEVVTGPTKVDGKITTPKPKKQKPTITRSRKRVDKGFKTDVALPTPKEPSTLAKAASAVQKNPVLGGLTGVAAYDLGKGILSKIMKLRGPGVRGGTVGRRSAGSFTAT